VSSTAQDVASRGRPTHLRSSGGATIAAALAAFVALQLGATGSAHAATVSKEANGAVTYEAAAGENNELSVSESGGYVYFTDPAGVNPAPGCVGVSATTARCDSAGIPRIYVHLADGANDFDTAAPRPVTVDGVGAIENVLYGGPFGDVLEGADGDDRLGGGGGDDVLAGSGGRDQIIGGAGDDQLAGGSDVDFLEGGLGADSFSGGPGTDRADYSTYDQPVVVTVGSLLGPDDGAAGEQDTVSSDVEDIYGGSGDDLLIGRYGAVNQFRGGPGDDRLLGAGGADLLIGGSGHDSLSGGDGDDGLVGDEGDDFLWGGNGADSLLGNSGIDSVSYEEYTAPVEVDPDGLADDGAVGEGDDVGTDIEVIIGGIAGDRLVGSAAPNRIVGGPGSDLINGKAGNDTLVGGTGGDRLRSKDGARDVDKCGAGSDRARADRKDRRRSCERSS
jgi:Ca2+-binding RTX toxin-like protein